MAFVIPITGIDFAPGRGPFAMLIIFTEENLQRMVAGGDPFDMQVGELPSIPKNVALTDLDLIIAYEPKEETIQRIVNEGGITALLAHVERNRVNLPGDAMPPVSVKPPKLRPQ